MTAAGLCNASCIVGYYINCLILYQSSDVLRIQNWSLNQLFFYDFEVADMQTICIIIDYEQDVEINCGLQPFLRYFYLLT